MAELVLGALLPVLFKRLASAELINFANREKVGDLVKKWETKLRSISVLLEDADDKAMRGDGRVQPWLDDLRDLAYDMEDVVDQFVTEEGIRSLSKLEASSGVSSASNKVRSLLPSCSTRLSPRKLMFDRKLRSMMKQIDGRLGFILEQKRDLGLNEGGGSIRRKKTSHLISGRMTTSVPEYYVVGRQEDERAILAKLLTEETDDDHHLSVIPIVGMGGVGKTTLARSVFNNSDAVKAFPQSGWVCVSDNFNMLQIARALLGSLTGGGCSVDIKDDLNVLHNKLREILSKEKFIIVLDDYWNEDYSDWECLYNLCRLGVKGSKIIVTTRLEKVASMMKTGPTYHRLGELSPGDCFSLLAYHALGGSSFDAHPRLKPIGKKIADKCGGLPLAAKTLGGLLRSKSDTSDWQDILDSEIWNLPQGRDGILPALRLSYFHLPSHLKRCFVYCAIFPTDYEFDPKELILLWIAEGFVEMDSHENPRMSMQNQGLKQFNDLLNRSFFQRSTQNKSQFVMHDLMHDLATSVGGITFLNVGLGDFDSVKGMPLEKVRHLSYISKDYELQARLEKCHIFKGLRTFLALQGGFHFLSNKVVEEMLQKLKYLRALSLTGYRIREVPNCIGHLKHLRYLDLSCSEIKELPESICTLYNLETLKLQGCRQLIELPRGIEKLVNLRCLDIRGTDALKKMPLGLVHLHKLEILPKFIVGKEEEDGLLRSEELKNFQFFQEELSIMDLQNVEEVEDARNAQLNAKVGLTTLVLQWNVSSGDSSSRNAEKEKHVLELLQPHQNIIRVKIDGYRGISFPSWIGSNSFVNITMLKLSKCRATTTLPSLGLLPSLKELEMEGMDAVCTVGPEFFGIVEIPFPSLEVLKFSEMPAWELWFSFGDEEIDQKPFPRLRELKLRQCPKLVSSWPRRIHSLVQLMIEDCPLEKLYSGSCSSDIVGRISSATSNALTRISLRKIKELRYLNADILSSLSAVESLEIEDCDELIRLWEDDNNNNVEAVETTTSLARLKSLRIERCANLQKLPNNMQRLTSLREFGINGCSKLETLPEGMMSCNLESLEVEECGSLRYFPEGAKLPTTLRTLMITECQKLERLPEGIVIVDDGHNGNPSISRSDNNAMLLDHNSGVFPSLVQITIYGCENIKSSTTLRLHVFSNLTYLVLFRCPYLEVDMLPQLPSSLKTLSLSRCDKIKSLPHQMHTTCTSLQRLSLDDLSIESFPEGGLPLSLEYLEVQNCKKLRQPMAEWGLHKLTALKTLWIDGCLCLQGMTCFPPSDWLMLPSNLESLWIYRQPNLRYVIVRSSGSCPRKDSHPPLDVLTSPTALEIYEASAQRAENTFPLSNAFLYCGVSDCKKLRQPMAGWGLHKLTALKTLSINGEIECLFLQGMSCFPPPPPPSTSKWLMLPSNLEFLWIDRQPNLVRLSNGLRNHLTYLQSLGIRESPKLRFLPREGFPPSLGYLDITGCSRDLESKCSKSGEYFPLIERVPRLEVLD